MRITYLGNSDEDLLDEGEEEEEEFDNEENED
jgi:hypothetical protein